MNTRHSSTKIAFVALLSVGGCLGQSGHDDLASKESPLFGGDLGVGLGSPVTTNNTQGRTNDYQPTCVSNSAAPDMAYTWTAPSAGSYTFSTRGSSFDTILEIREYNTGGSLGCNDDSNGTTQSTVSASLTAGQTIIIVVDGYGTASGPFELNIEGSATRSYTCGYALPGYGCNNGRNHAFVRSTDMTAAIGACHAAQLTGYTDFCYVMDTDGATSSDVSECSAGSASWRAGNNCCNFLGSLSCP